MNLWSGQTPAGMKGKDIMRSLRIIFVLATVLAAAVAISADREHTGGTTLAHGDRQSASHPSSAASPQEPASHDHSAVEHNDHAQHHDIDNHSHPRLYNAQDALAIADMHHYALLHFGIFEEHDNTFRVADQWDDTWIYRSIEIGLTDGHTLRLCHATHRHDGNRRFVAVWDSEQRQYGAWEAAH